VPEYLADGKPPANRLRGTPGRRATISIDRQAVRQPKPTIKPLAAPKASRGGKRVWAGIRLGDDVDIQNYQYTKLTDDRLFFRTR
jgi:hypothetical protein